MEYENNFNTSRMTRINYNKILDILQKNKHIQLIKNVYRPINPIHPFNSKIISPDELSKRENALLINNKSLKDIILKFNDEKRKKNQELIRSHQYYYHKFINEDKKYNLALKTILKKDFNNLPSFLREKKERKDDKKNKINLKIKISRNDNNFSEKYAYNNRSIGFLTTTCSKMKSFKIDGGYLDLTNRKIQSTEYNKKIRNVLTNKTKCSNLEHKIKLIKKTLTNKELKFAKKIKIKINNLNIRKQLNFSVTNMNSAKLGKISLFGAFEDNGAYGKTISSIIINYLIDYFEKSKEMVVSLEKDNFYSILHWSFVNAQKYLIKNARKFNIDIYKSGCSACIVLVPNNKRNIFYCANSGKCKCILYTNRGIDNLSFISRINRASERDRIRQFIQDKNSKKKDTTEKKQNENILEEKKSENNIIISIKKNNGKKEQKNNNIDKSNNSIKIEDNSKIEEETSFNLEKYVKYFKEFGITRCFGNISGAEMGLVPDPEVTECDIRMNKVKYAVVGNTIFWRILDEKEVRYIVSKYMENNDTAAATKELEELIKQRVGISSKILFDYSFSVIYFDTII
jgi:serine/threonine protein phosphatase PrpC